MIPFDQDILHSFLDSNPTVAPKPRFHKGQLDSIRPDHLLHNKRIIRRSRNRDGVIPKFAIFLMFGFEGVELRFGYGERKGME